MSLGYRGNFWNYYKVMATSGLELQLGDIVHIRAPRNQEIGEDPLLVKQFGAEWLRLVGRDGQHVDVALDSEGAIEDESIESIELLSRSEHPGYARQNGLVPGAWVDLHFGGDLPITLTGQVTDIDEDQIEIKTLDGSQPLYIDFAYRGIPEDIPLDKIHLRSGPPKGLALSESQETGKEPVGAEEEDDSVDAAEDEDVEFADIGAGADGQLVREEVLDPDEIVIGEEMAAVKQIVDVPEEERRFGLDKQTNDMLDDLLSSVPTAKRTAERVNAIHRLIERFKQLRSEFSVFEGGAHVSGALQRGPDYKPMVAGLSQFETDVAWLIPVSKNRKKIYDVDPAEAGEYDDVVGLSQEDVQAAEDRIVDAYESNATPDGASRYDTMLQELSPLWQPWDEPGQDDGPTLISTRAQTGMRTVVDNSDDFYSSVYSGDGISQKRFFVQPHAPGLSVLSVVTHRSGEKTFTRRGVTEGDPVAAVGLLSLPAPAVAASRARLPGTMIAERVDMGDALSTSAGVLTDTANVRTAYADEGELRVGLGEIVEHVPRSTDGLPSWRAFLQQALPSTKNALKVWLPARSPPALSAHAAIDWMEPFRIYQRDISRADYEGITEHVSNAQREYLSTSPPAPSRPTARPDVSPALLRLLGSTAGNSIVKEIEEAYGLSSSLLAGVQDGEMLARIRAVDEGRLLMAALARVSVKLLIGDPEAQAKMLAEKVEVRERTAADPMRATCDKAVPVLAKKYMAEDEMKEDDGKEVSFDRQLDPTFYDVLPGYKTQLEEANSSQEKQQLLETELGTRVGLSGTAARREAAALLAGRRVVEDGDFAVVEPEGALGPASYFVRKGQQWVEAPEVTRDTFSAAPKVACALVPGCVDTRGICEPTPSAKAALVQQDLDDIEKEFDLAMEKDSAKRRKGAELSYTQALARVGLLRQLEDTRNLGVQRRRAKLGMEADLASIARSPYAPIRDRILSQGDFAKRQTNVAEFVTKFTRGAYENSDESMWWLYCVDSGLKLLPAFLSRLANAFLGGRDYLEAVRQVCAEQGTISDDGDVWVDKYSGYAIVPIDYDDDEGYTEAGFKIQTREVLEDALGVSSKGPSGAARFTDPSSRQIAQTAAGLANFMGVPIEASLDYIVRGVSSILARAMPTRERYEQNMALRREKGKKGGLSYDQARAQMVVLLTASFSLLAIQTQVPPVIPSLRHPGCVATFEGYPFGPESDTGAIKYTACILRSVSKSIPPWDSLKGVSTATITKKLHAFISGQVRPQAESLARISDRREFDRLNPVEPRMLDPGLQSWTGFLPPLNPVKVKATEGLTPALARTIEGEVRRGSQSQSVKLRLLRGREIMLSLKIIELVERTVATKGLALSTAAGEPYLENSCCDDGSRNPLEYFASAEPAILEKNEQVELARDFLDGMGAMARGPFLFDATDTRRQFPAPPPGFSERTIYQAFIVFCKFNAAVPASARLRAVCMEKPAALDVSASIDEKIDLLKAEGHNYSSASLDALMRIINEMNLVSLDLGRAALGPEQEVRSTLAEFPGDYVDELATLIDGALGGKGDGTKGRELRNFLAERSVRSRRDTTAFIERFGRGREARRARDCLGKLSDDGGDEEHATPLWVLKNRGRLIGRVFPNIVLNSVAYEDELRPEHWNLSIFHGRDVDALIARYYSRLVPYYGDPRLRPLLAAYEVAAKPLVVLLERLHEGSESSSLSPRTVRLLSAYLVNQLFSVFVELATRSPQILAEGVAAFNAESNIEGGDVLDPSLEMGAQETLAHRAAGYLVGVIETLCEQARVCDVPYQEVMYRVHRAKEHEKDIYTRRLRELTDEERDANMQLKRNKLGEWGKGLQKGMRVYQAETYDEEITAMERQAMLEMRMGGEHMVTAMNRDIYAMDAIAEQAEADRIEAEEMSLAHLGDDDDHGDRDGDEGY